MRAIAHAHAKECNHASLKYREAFMTIAIGRRGGGTLLVNLRRSNEEYCIVGVYSIKGEVNSFTTNSIWWSRVILVVYLELNKYRWPWDGIKILLWGMLPFVRS